MSELQDDEPINDEEGTVTDIEYSDEEEVEDEEEDYPENESTIDPVEELQFVIQEIDLDDEDDDEPDFEVISNIEMANSQYIITKYEKTRIIGVRKEQLRRGAAPCVPFPDDIVNIEELAEKEFQAGVLPLCITRRSPNGKGIRIPVSQLIDISPLK